MTLVPDANLKWVGLITHRRVLGITCNKAMRVPSPIPFKSHDRIWNWQVDILTAGLQSPLRQMHDRIDCIMHYVFRLHVFKQTHAHQASPAFIHYFKHSLALKLCFFTIKYQSILTVFIHAAPWTFFFPQSKIVFKNQSFTHMNNPWHHI